MLEFWRDNQEKFPNLAVMARQYLGLRLPSHVSIRRAPVFSAVGIAFSAKRKSAHSDTLEDMMFARANLP